MHDQRQVAILRPAVDASRVRACRRAIVAGRYDTAGATEETVTHLCREVLTDASARTYPQMTQRAQIEDR